MMKSSLAFWRILQTVPRRYSIALFFLTIATSLTEGVSVFLLAPILGLLYRHAGDTSSGAQAAGLGLRSVAWFVHVIGLEGVLILFVLVIAIRSGLQYAKDAVSTTLLEQIVDSLRMRALRGLLSANWRWLAHRRQSDDANLLLIEIGRLRAGLQAAFALSAATVSAISCLIAALLLSWKLTCVAVASCGIVFLLMGKQRTAASALGREWGQSIRMLHGQIAEALQGIRMAKIFAAEEIQLDRTADTIRAAREKQLLFTARSSRARSFFQVAAAILLSAYIYIGIVIWHAALPVVLTLVFILGRLTPLFASTHQQLHQWLHAVPAWDNVSGLIAQSEANAESDQRHGAAGPFNATVRQSIRLDNVSVRYAGRTQPALDAISLSLRAGSTTALAGASGAGKSTLADVLAGLISADSGVLQVDGVTIDADVQRAWRSRVAYVTQDAWFYHGSIRENLRMAAKEADDEALLQVLEKASCEFVLALPDQLDTVIGDGGTRLSGGERQRLALARALLRRPALLILDEATSALDPANEAHIQHAIATLKGSTIIVLIGHRPSAVAQADEIIYLEQGKTAIGPHIAASSAI